MEPNALVRAGPLKMGRDLPILFSSECWVTVAKKIRRGSALSAKH
jgi:hypothetical protein